jgi:hypothetical protein
MTQFVAATPAGKILYGMGRPDPVGFTGVPDMRPFPRDGTIFYPWQSKLALTGPEETHEYRWTETGPQWIDVATLAQKRTARIEAMRVACEQQIVAGFMCDALGEAHLYPAKAQDQANLIASVTDSLMAGDDPAWRTQFWCADGTGTWEFRDHTVAQIQQVGKMGKAAILMSMGKNELLRRQIDAAMTVAEIEAITW